MLLRTLLFHWAFALLRLELDLFAVGRQNRLLILDGHHAQLSLLKRLVIHQRIVLVEEHAEESDGLADGTLLRAGLVGDGVSAR